MNSFWATATATAKMPSSSSPSSSSALRTHSSTPLRGHPTASKTRTVQSTMTSTLRIEGGWESSRRPSLHFYVHLCPGFSWYTGRRVGVLDKDQFLLTRCLLSSCRHCCSAVFFLPFMGSRGCYRYCSFGQLQPNELLFSLGGEVRAECQPTNCLSPSIKYSTLQTAGTSLSRRSDGSTEWIRSMSRPSYMSASLRRMTSGYMSTLPKRCWHRYWRVPILGKTRSTMTPWTS